MVETAQAAQGGPTGGLTAAPLDDVVLAMGVVDNLRHADTLVRAGFLMVEDVPRVVAHAERSWIWLTGPSAAANRRLTSGGYSIDSSTAGNPR